MILHIALHLLAALAIFAAGDRKGERSLDPGGGREGRTVEAQPVIFVAKAPPPGSWDYSYGGATRGLWGSDSVTGLGMLRYRGDDRDYSGWTLHLERSADLSRCLDRGALRFRVRGLRGGERVIVGLLDAPPGGGERKVQVRIDLAGALRIGKEWQDVTLPLRDFGTTGLWWDARRLVEMPAPIDWSRIQEFRVSSDRGLNAAQRDPSGIVEVQFSDVRIERDVPPPWDATAHWKTFRSDAADLLVHAASDSSTDRGETGRLGTRLRLEVRDWSHHAALRMERGDGKGYATVRFHVVDSSGETWSTSFAAPPGNAPVTVPFSRFACIPTFQGASSASDRRFDLEAVREAYMTSPERLGLRSILLTNDLGDGDPQIGAAVLANSVGWRPEAAKRFLVPAQVAGEEREFDLLDSNGRSVRFGKLEPYGWWEAAQESLLIGDVSRWTRPGIFRISVGKLRGPRIRIGEDVYDSLVASSLRAFRFQRAVPQAAADGLPARGAHADTALAVLGVPGEEQERRDVHGGWYDAGDYGKYVVSAGISTWSLLQLEALAPQGGRARDEALFETEWLERMQDRDGGVYFKVAPRAWSDFVLPEKDIRERFIIGKSTTSSLDFAASLALSSRSLAKTDPVRAERLLGKARRAWRWALSHPSVPEPSEVGGSGSYEDAHPSDEFLWAAVELWLASGSAADRSEVERRFGEESFTEGADWQHVQTLALLSLALCGRDDELVRTARTRLEELADSVHAALERSPARIPLEGFVWGSNGELLNRGLVLMASHRLTGNRARLDDLQELLDYVLGRNAFGRSFVTGFGERPPERPHQRLLGGASAFPGFLVGGPNAGREDELAKDPEGVVYPRKAPALSWVDRTDAYACNEIAINWNAPLALVSGYLAGQGRVR